MAGIHVQELVHGVLCDFQNDSYPSQVHGWCGAALRLGAVGTHYGLVMEGRARLKVEQGEFLLQAGMYFAVPGAMEVEGALGWVATRLAHRGLFQMGGPLEAVGRLRYIDGCTDSLLVAPALCGDPCLNMLHLPPHVVQSPHTHPSLRAGVVVSGMGRCLTATATLPLQPGLAFVIRADEVHHFETDQDPLQIVAFHPDSDWGPTNENHPMINRTILQ